MKNKLTLMFCVAFLAALCAAPTAFGQCSPTTGVIHVGESLCLQLCADESYAYTLEDGGRPGPENYPILTMAAGCHPLTTNCAVPGCDPLSPPDTLVLGGDPFDLDSYYGYNDCFDIHLYWVHDDVWTIEIYSFCDGCFCITYDRQLPVELMEFTAHPRSNAIELHWATASESETDRFEIERDHQTVTSVDASGSSSIGARYAWTDNNVVSGVTYEYRLVEVTMGGSRIPLGSITASTVNTVLPVEHALYQNFPNPFNPETSISFDLATSDFVTLTVYNLAGQQVTTLVNREMAAGHNIVRFSGAGLGSGMYLYKLEAGSFSDTKKMMILK